MVDFTDSVAYTRYIAAGSPWTPPTVLRRLAEDADPHIRRRVAENPAIPPDVVDRLIRDPQPDVRIALSENSTVMADYSEMLIADQSAEVRFALAENSLTPDDLLIRLATDDNPYVASRARRTYEKKNPHAMDEMLRLSLLPNPQLSTPPNSISREAG